MSPIKFSDENRQDRSLERVRVKEGEESARKIAEDFSLPYLNLAMRPIQHEALEIVPEREARQANLAVILKKSGALTVALRDPENPDAKNIVQNLEKRFEAVHIFISSLHSLEKAWGRYKREGASKKISGHVAISARVLDDFQQKITSLADLEGEIEDITKQKNASLIMELLLASALALRASDIHVEPSEEYIRLRLRIDGIMHDAAQFDSHVYKLLLSRIKLLSSMKLNIHNTAQDGRFSVSLGDQDIQIRTSVLPGEYGENIVMRVLNPESLLSIKQLGIRPDLLAVIGKYVERPNGMVLATGPTGSGKTTTLYAFLKKLQTPEVKIVTIEDPIEYHLTGISQTQVSPERGYTFASGLRSILRQDPDVILVGEIRDLETADIALQAALTGHLVLSTLHTNDAAGVVPRLSDIGASLTVVGPALGLAIAQRLVRRVCKKCVTFRKVTEQELAHLTQELSSLPKSIKLPKALTPDLEMAEPKGCEICANSGYKGRVGVYEALANTPEFEKFILTSPSVTEIREFVTGKGMTTLKQDGFLKVLEGVTTIKEVERVTGT